MGGVICALSDWDAEWNKESANRQSDVIAFPCCHIAFLTPQPAFLTATKSVPHTRRACAAFLPNQWRDTVTEFTIVYVYCTLVKTCDILFPADKDQTSLSLSVRTKTKTWDQNLPCLLLRWSRCLLCWCSFLRWLEDLKEHTQNNTCQHMSKIGLDVL